MKKIENNLLNALSVSRYSESYANLAKDRIIFLCEDITKDTASSVSAMLLFYDDQNDKEDISIYINTNGGDASALANIYDVMQIIKSPIKTVCIGKAYSAGAYILSAGTKGKRFITKNASVMIHGIQCEFPGIHEDQKNSEIYYKFLNTINKNTLGILVKHTGKSFEEIDEICKKDTFLDADEAVKYCIVDNII